jgi:hypothetical protein
MFRNRKPKRKNRAFHLETLERRDLMSATTWTSMGNDANRWPDISAAAELVQFSTPSPEIAAASGANSNNSLLRQGVPANWQTNFILSNAYLVDAQGNGLNGKSPEVGDTLYARVRIFTHNLHEGKSYSIQFIVDGNVREFGPFDKGTGLLANEWSKTFALGKVKPGRHTIQVILNPPGPGWAEENPKALDDNRKEITFRAAAAPPELVNVRSLQDVDIKGVNDVVWSKDSKKGEKGKPIADGRNSNHFIIRPTIKYGGYAAGEVEVRYGVTINGASITKGLKLLDPSGQIVVPTPSEIGIYQLELQIQLFVPSKGLYINREIRHTLYVTMDEPSLKDPVPEKWLETATRMAQGKENAVDALNAINAGLHKVAKEKGWKYAQNANAGSGSGIGDPSRAEDLLYGTETRANCLDLVHAWKHVADVLGIKGVSVSAERDRIFGDIDGYSGNTDNDGKGFLTKKNLKAFDGSVGNARAAGTKLRDQDRWYFDWHQLGRYTSGDTVKFFDPTFNGQYNSLKDWRVNIAADSQENFGNTFLREGTSIDAKSVATGAIVSIYCEKNPRHTKTGNSQYIYS